VIAIDTSALVAIAMKEPEATAFKWAIQTIPCLVGIPTLLELHLVLSNRPEADADAFVEELERLPRIRFVSFGMAHLAVARTAFDRFGRGRNPQSALNYGDCMAYAVAKVHGAPLLFKGQDFLATDIEPAIRT
jgi:ribonuclease VapC